MSLQKGPGIIAQKAKILWWKFNEYQYNRANVAQSTNYSYPSAFHCTPVSTLKINEKKMTYKLSPLRIGAMWPIEL